LQPRTGSQKLSREREPRQPRSSVREGRPERLQQHREAGPRSYDAVKQQRQEAGPQVRKTAKPKQRKAVPQSREGERQQQGGHERGEGESQGRR
jgi:hypothetical protein